MTLFYIYFLSIVGFILCDQLSIIGGTFETDPSCQSRCMSDEGGIENSCMCQDLITHHQPVIGLNAINKLSTNGMMMRSLRNCTDESSPEYDDTSKTYCFIHMLQYTELVKCTEAYYNMNATHQQEIVSLDSQLKTCKIHVEESEAQYNIALQKFLILEDRYRDQEKIYNLSIAAYDKRLAKVDKEMRDLKVQSEKSKDRYLESISIRTKLEKDINDLRFAATRTYVNTTLIIEDWMRFATRCIDRLIRLKNRITLRLAPFFTKKKTKLHQFFHKNRSWINPWMIFKKKSLQKIHGILTSLTKNFWLLNKLFTALSNFIKGTRLSIASIIDGLDLFLMRMLNIPFQTTNGMMHPVFKENRIAMCLLVVHENVNLVADFIVGFVITAMFPVFWTCMFRFCLFLSLSALTFMAFFV